MSSSVNIRLARKRKASQRQAETAKFMIQFTKQHGRQPTLKEIAAKFNITVPSAWERTKRVAKNSNCCAYCGNFLT